MESHMHGKHLTGWGDDHEDHSLVLFFLQSTNDPHDHHPIQDHEDPYHEDHAYVVDRHVFLHNSVFENRTKQQMRG